MRTLLTASLFALALAGAGCAEREATPTPEAAALTRIYRGEWSDYVQCKACRYRVRAGPPPPERCNGHTERCVWPSDDPPQRRARAISSARTS